MVTIVIFVAVLMIMFSVSRVNAARARRRRRRGIDWSGMKKAEQREEKTPDPKAPQTPKTR